MSTFGDAAAVPPELNHTLMIAGDLGASLVQAAAGYESVADMLIAELTQMGLNTSTTAMVGWLGPGGEMMQMSAAEFMAVCAAASAWIRVGQVQAAEVAAAHTAAVEMMIPSEACITNRVTQAGLVATNWFGQNTPAITGLEAQYEYFWVSNAQARTGFGGVVSTALATIGTPPPMSPTASNPAAALAAVGADAAQGGAQSAFQSGTHTMMAAAEAPAGAGGSAQNLMGSMGGQAGALFGQVGSAFGQVTSAGQSLPSMLGQGPSMMSGLLGPLSSSMTGLNGTPVGALAPGVTGAAVPSSLGALAGGGGGGGGLAGGASGLSSTFVRPANSFSSPSTPTLPGGWQSSSEPGAQTRPAASGGLYGAPPPVTGAAGGGPSAASPARALQVTARSGAAGREGQQRS
ncbi:PPE domain-containing protein [Mycobacterium intracellulare]|uniref:PPE domain-containing protein n=1 Tax=Mycobacterium intracellulare TaxID=1767 RepID=UPI0009EA8EA8|nr:PPE domain-containing protein [Mycobacterium intracellulare]